MQLKKKCMVKHSVILTMLSAENNSHRCNSLPQGITWDKNKHLKKFLLIAVTFYFMPRLTSTSKR